MRNLLLQFNPEAGNYALDSHSLIPLLLPRGMEKRNGQRGKLVGWDKDSLTW